jgi:hypothetical protein
MFAYRTKESASDKAAPLIERSIKTYGFLPKLRAVLVEALAAYQAHLDTFSLFENESSFSPLEQQIVFQTANFENNCHFCIPGRSFIMKLKVCQKRSSNPCAKELP